MASGDSREKLGRTGRSSSAPLARHRVDQPTISGRSRANLGHYKSLFACVDRTFGNQNFIAPARPEKNRACPACGFFYRRDLYDHGLQETVGIQKGALEAATPTSQKVPHGVGVAKPH